MNPNFISISLLLLTTDLCFGNIIDVRVYGTHGKNTTFTTTIKPTSDLFVSVSWAVNGSFIITSTISNTIVEPKYADRTTLFRETGSLELRNLTNEDSGVYTVTIIPASGHLISGAAVLEVQPKIPTPTVTCPPSTEGMSEVTFLCDDGDTSNAKQWTRDGQPLLPSDRIAFLENNRIIMLKGVNRTDTAEYRCNVSNLSDHEVATCQLTVYYGPDTPTVQQHPNPAVEEEQLTLSCASDSLPPATFTWEFQRRPLVPGPQHVIAELDEDHLGNYTCTARNDLTGLVVSTVYTLNALALCPGQAALGAGSLTGVTGGRMTFETNLSLTDQNTTLSFGLFNLNNIVLYTPAGSLVSPAYRKRISLNTTSGWLDLWDLTVGDSGAYTVDITTHTDQQLNGSTGLNVYERVSSVTVTPNTTELLEFSSSIGDIGTTLTILNVTRYDRGPYTCNVSNPVSNDVGRPLTLTIGCPSLVEFGEVTLLYCSAMSVPPPSYTWSLNGVHTTVQGPVYVIASVNSSDYGKYTCTAVNTLTDLSQAADHVVSLKENRCSAAIAKTAAVMAACFVAVAAGVGVVVGVIARRVYKKLTHLQPI
ncbi:unnamed protein product [Arctogadus glacialis]